MPERREVATDQRRPCAIERRALGGEDFEGIPRTRELVFAPDIVLVAEGEKIIGRIGEGGGEKGEKLCATPRCPAGSVTGVERSGAKAASKAGLASEEPSSRQ